MCNHSIYHANNFFALKTNTYVELSLIIYKFSIYTYIPEVYTSFSIHFRCIFCALLNVLPVRCVRGRYKDLGTLSVTYAPADSSDGVGFADVDKHQRHCH